MAQPAIWRPPKIKVPGLQRQTLLGRGLLQSLIGRYPQHPVNIPGLTGRGNTQQQTTGGGSPYASLLQDYMNQARADFGAQSTAERGDLINAIRKYMISYGSSPNFDVMGGLGKDAQGYLKEALDTKTLGLMKKAEEEGLSSHARLGQANEKATRLIPAALAARGILRSGQTGSDLADQAMQYKQSGYDMLNELMGAITGGVSNFQNAERERQRQLAEMEMQMAMQAAQDWGDSYFEEPAPPPGAPANAGRPTTATRPKRPGPNYVWNGKRWVYKPPKGPGWKNPPGGGGGAGHPRSQ